MRQEGPSVEEILQSIKRVMARDNQELLRQQGEARDGAAALPDDQHPEPADEDEADDVLDMPSAPRPDDHEPGPVTQTLPAYDEASPYIDDEAGALPGDEAEALTSRNSTEAMRRSLAALELLARSKDASGEGANPSLDATVRDMLRPMLAEWLDANLPAIVERQVRAEITRIAGGGS